MRLVILGVLRLGKTLLLSIQQWYTNKLLNEYNVSFKRRESCYEKEQETKRKLNEAYRKSIALAVQKRQAQVHKVNDRSRVISDTLNQLSEL